MLSSKPWGGRLMLSTVHPRRSFSRAFPGEPYIPAFLNCAAGAWDVWPACNPAPPKTPSLSDSGTDITVWGVGLTHIAKSSLEKRPLPRGMGAQDQHAYYIWWIHSSLGDEKAGVGPPCNSAPLHLASSYSPRSLSSNRQVCTTAHVGKVCLDLLAALSACSRTGCIYSMPRSPSEHSALTAQQLQTCLALLKVEPLLLQENSSLCSETKVHSSLIPRFPKALRSSGDRWRASFSPCLCRMFLKRCTVDL